MKHSKLSKIGIIAASFYLLTALTLFIFHLYSVKTNAGDSGESVIPVVMLSLPWVMLIPESWIQTELWAWMAYPVLLFCIGINVVLIYGACALITFIMSWLMSKILARIHHFTFPKQK